MKGGRKEKKTLMLGRFEYVKAVRVCASLPISVNLPIMKVGLFELCCCCCCVCTVHTPPSSPISIGKGVHSPFSPFVCTLLIFYEARFSHFTLNTLHFLARSI